MTGTQSKRTILEDFLFYGSEIESYVIPELNNPADEQVWKNLIYFKEHWRISPDGRCLQPLLIQRCQQTDNF